MQYGFNLTKRTQQLIKIIYPMICNELVTSLSGIPLPLKVKKGLIKLKVWPDTLILLQYLCREHELNFLTRSLLPFRVDLPIQSWFMKIVKIIDLNLSRDNNRPRDVQINSFLSRSSKIVMYKCYAFYVGEYLIKKCLHRQPRWDKERFVAVFLSIFWLV